MPRIETWPVSFDPHSWLVTLALLCGIALAGVVVYAVVKEAPPAAAATEPPR